MKAERHVQIEVSLRLTEDEAIWLHAVMQNPWCENESQDRKTMREKFFETLNFALQQDTFGTR